MKPGGSSPDEPPPDMKDGLFKSNINDDWAMYIHTASNRPFYVNTKTNCAQWRMARGKYKVERERKVRI